MKEKRQLTSTVYMRTQKASLRVKTLFSVTSCTPSKYSRTVRWRLHT